MPSLMAGDNVNTATPRMVHRGCPLCAADDVEAFLSAGDSTFGFPGTFHVVRCRRCGMLYTDPQVVPEDIAAFYPADYSAHAAGRAERRRGGRAGRDPWDRLPEIGRKRLLDVGCGSGAYLLRQKQAGWQVYGVEPAAAAAEAARRHGLEVVQGVIPGAKLPKETFDIVTMLGVLDHVPAPLATLRELHGRLAAGGRLIVSAPNAASAAAETFGADWPGWDLPRHQNHFTPETLAEMLRRAGFAGVELSWKRRTSRWQRGARLRAESAGSRLWRCVAASRNLCSVLAHARSRGERSDEVVAIGSTC
jgi:SAM-dependent methyltransferase